MRSGVCNLVVVDINSKSDLILRSLRERLRLITPHWQLYPEILGVSRGRGGDFNICETEKGRFNKWNPTFTDGDVGKAALFYSFLLMSFRFPQHDITRRDSTADSTIRTLSKIDKAFSNLPMTEALDFQSYSHVFQNLDGRSIQSDHATVSTQRHSKTDNATQPGQTHSELDVQISRLPSILKQDQ